MSKKEDLKAKDVKLKNLIEDIRSLDKKKFTAAIEAIKSHGDNSVISVFVEVFPKCSPEQKIEIFNLIADIRDEDAPEVIMDAILESDNEELRVHLLSTIWNSNGDYNDYLNNFVKIAIQGSFAEAIECHTIIDNLMGPFDEASIMDAKIFIKENMKIIVEDTQKSFLLSDILLKIEEFDQEVES